MSSALFSLLWALAPLWPAATQDEGSEPREDELRLNQIQLLGTHNSYHQAPRSPLVRLSALARDSWDYSHAPLAVQLEELGVRQFELDLWCDPEGGRFARPWARLPREDEQIDPALLRPGTKVLHVPDVDFETSCGTLAACLSELMSWSTAHPQHLPIMVLLELKQDQHEGPLGMETRSPHPWGAAELDRLDATIRAAIPENRLLTPDQVRGERASLEEAVLQDGWPALSAVRGRVLFCMDNSGAARALYRAGRPALEGRVLFTNATPGEPDAAFVKLNDPLRDEERIRSLVQKGYLVRTRADADLREARENDGRRSAAALESGAHFISTDFPAPSDTIEGGYVVRLPGGGVGRGNPVSAPRRLRGPLFEPQPPAGKAPDRDG